MKNLQKNEYLVIFLNFLGPGWFWGKIFLAKLNFRQIPKTLLPKSFLQFETPRSLVLAPNPLPQYPQKFNSINAPYTHTHTHTHTYILFHSLSPFLRVPVTPELKKNICVWGPGLAESDAVTFFAVLPVSWLPEDKSTRNFRIFSS